jgi:hypothetical protein
VSSHVCGVTVVCVFMTCASSTMAAVHTTLLASRNPILVCATLSTYNNFYIFTSVDYFCKSNFECIIMFVVSVGIHRLHCTCVAHIAGVIVSAGSNEGVVSCECHSGYVGNGTVCNGNAMETISTGSVYSSFYSVSQ